MLNTNLVVIELTNEETVPYFNSEQEIFNFLNKMNINLPRIDDQDAFPTCSESYKYSTLEHKLWMAILSGITGSVWWRVWLNPENGYVIAYEDYERNGKYCKSGFAFPLLPNSTLTANCTSVDQIRYNGYNFTEGENFACDPT